MSTIRHEQDVDSQLPLYQWLNIERPAPETEITDESFQVTRNKNEYQETEDENGRAAHAARRAAKLALEMTPVVLSKIRHKSLADVYKAKPVEEPIAITNTQNGQEKWPGEDAIEAGERPIFEPETPEDVESRVVQYGLFALGALKARTSSLVNLVREGEIDAAKYAQIAKKPLSAAKTVAQTGFEKGREWIKDEERQKKLRKSALALGGIALTAVAVLYAEQKGLPGIHHSHAAQEASHNSAPQSTATPQEFTVPLHAQAVAAQAALHAHKASEILKNGGQSVVVKAGMGYTQLIEKLKPGHTPAAYLGAYKQAIHQFGPGFIKGVGHYRMPDGSWGLSGLHKAEISGKALRFISDYLKSNR